MTAMERFARAEGRAAYRLPFPDFPSHARSFVHLDARLLPYWHALFDVCPGLLKLDPPDGLNLFRQFMTWAYGRQLALDWTLHLNVCRWLLGSPYGSRVDDELVDAMLVAAAQSPDTPYVGGRLSIIDGLRVDFPDGWGLVRASNTTPVLVLRFEGNDEAALERIQALFRSQLQPVLGDTPLGF